jgi:uncharacterized low-complexity protein
VSENKLVRPITLVGSIALAGAFAALSAAEADSDTSPFVMTALPSGYLLSAEEGVCGEGKCGEGKCGGDDKGAHTHPADQAEGACGEGKCGEGKCGGDDKGAHMHEAAEDQDA